VPGEEELRPRVRQVEAGLARLEQDVHGDDDPACAEDPVVGHREVRDVREHDADAVARADAARPQQPGHAGARLVELAVGDDRVVELEGGPLGAALGARGEEGGEVDAHGATVSAARRARRVAGPSRGATLARDATPPGRRPAGPRGRRAPHLAAPAAAADGPAGARAPGLVHAGVPAVEGERPFQAAVLEAGVAICGGVVLDARRVATAAHCVFGSDQSYLLAQAPSALRTFTGSVRLGGGGQRAEVAQVSFDPRFEARSFDYDVAVLHLDRPLALDRATAPIAPAAATPPDGTPALVSGWGEIRGDDPYDPATRFRRPSASGSCGRSPTPRARRPTPTCPPPRAPPCAPRRPIPARARTPARATRAGR
jgi:hypothetical protein